jgi:hypothetical protein
MEKVKSAFEKAMEKLAEIGELNFPFKKSS